MREVLFQYLYIRKNRGISSPFFEFQAKRPSEFACLRAREGSTKGYGSKAVTQYFMNRDSKDLAYINNWKEKQSEQDGVSQEALGFAFSHCSFWGQLFL